MAFDLRDISIDRGASWRSGIGLRKSAMMNIIGCLDGATAGTYHLVASYRTLDEFQLAQIRNRKIGFVFQNFT